MNTARKINFQILSKIAGIAKEPVRNWFIVRNYSIDRIEHVRAFLIEYLLNFKTKKRFDKGKTRPTPQLDKYKFKKKDENNKGV
jgi:hypothetical protein